MRQKYLKFLNESARYVAKCDPEWLLKSYNTPNPRNTAWSLLAIRTALREVGMLPPRRTKCLSTPTR